MGVRSGAQYLASLRDNRQIFVNGEVVSDVTDYPAFRRGAAEMARVYDLQHDPAYQPLLTYPSPSDGAPVSTSFLMATTMDELDRRIQGESLRADLTCKSVPFCRGPSGWSSEGITFAAMLRTWASSPSPLSCETPSFR